MIRSITKPIRCDYLKKYQILQLHWLSKRRISKGCIFCESALCLKVVTVSQGFQSVSKLAKSEISASEKTSNSGCQKS